MPEGHTIHRLARDQTRQLGRQSIAVSSPQGRYIGLAAILDGHRLEAVEARGKHLFYHWRGAPILHIHLGLFGRLVPSVSPPAEPRPSVQLRLVGRKITLDLIGATTGELLDTAGRQRIVDRLGPDVLAEDADPERAWHRLQRRTMPIAAALLDQAILSGVGNVYRVEALFVNGIHPERPANSLTRSEFDALWTTLQRMLRQGVEDRRIVTVPRAERGSPDAETVAPEDAFYVYKQQRCRRCAAPIRTWRLGARQAYACEACQSPPLSLAADHSPPAALSTRRSALLR